MKILETKFNADTFLKRTICDSMSVDANQFLWRVHYLIRLNDFADRNWYSKIYVDLIMAVETDLKAIIVALSESSETPEEAYNSAREKKHNITKLYTEVEKRAKNRLKLLHKKDRELLLNKYCLLNVSNRYDLVTFYGIREDIKNKNFTDNSVKSILTYKSLIELEKITNRLHQITNKAVNKKPMISMSGNNMENYFKRLDLFKTNIKRI
jgi:hypothetical protein